MKGLTTVLFLVILMTSVPVLACGGCCGLDLGNWGNVQGWANTQINLSNSGLNSKMGSGLKLNTGAWSNRPCNNCAGTGITTGGGTFQQLHMDLGNGSFLNQFQGVGGISTTTINH